jgi:hypothetical protein
MMKKMFGVMVILCVIVTSAFGQSNPKIETITYINLNGQQKTVRAVYMALEERYVTIEGSGINTWMVCYSRAKPDGGNWTTWEKDNEYPLPNATNTLLEEVTRALHSEALGKCIESTHPNFTMLEQYIKDDSGRDRWWENRREIHWLLKVYVVVP